MALVTRVAAVLAILAAEASASSSSVFEEAQANPIRKVVSMLQAMQKRISGEGEKEEELYSKFMCYCKNGAGNLQKSIAEAETKIPQVSSDVEETEAKLKQNKEDVKKAKADRAAAKATMADATAIRNKEAAAFASEKAELSANLNALKEAIHAVEKGMNGFLQTDNAQYLRQFVTNKQDLAEYDREELVAFLSGKESGEYAPKSGEITGILKEISDTMAQSLANAEANEESAVNSFEELMAAKTKEVAALTRTLEEKTVRGGEMAVSIVEMKADVDDTQKALTEDKQFLGNMDANCAKKSDEHLANTKLRSEELLALSETIEMLNDDDALELFKKTLPSGSASFVQMMVSIATQKSRALAEIAEAKRKLGKPSPRLDFIALAIQGKKVDFGVVLKMIDNMIAVLKNEQDDDQEKKKYCTRQFDLTDDQKKAGERTVANHETAIAKTKEALASLADEIQGLEKGIQDLDKSVVEATEQRKEENQDFTALMASDRAAKELLGMARNRLNKFYNPSLHEPPKAQEVVLATISKHEVAPPPPPATAAAYSKKSEESNNVIATIDVLIKDLDKEITEAQTEEKDAQADYEQAMTDSREKRSVDSQTLTDKTSAKAKAEAALEASSEAKAAASAELMATLEHISALHGECDWLLQYFGVRKEARDGEIESLKNARGVLSGADFSLLQMQGRNLRGGR